MYTCNLLQSWATIQGHHAVGPSSFYFFFSHIWISVCLFFFLPNLNLPSQFTADVSDHVLEKGQLQMLRCHVHRVTLSEILTQRGSPQGVFRHLVSTKVKHSQRLDILKCQQQSEYENFKPFCTINAIPFANFISIFNHSYNFNPCSLFNWCIHVHFNSLCARVLFW